MATGQAKSAPVKQIGLAPIFKKTRLISYLKGIERHKIQKAPTI